jgi:hypothetical protein
MSRRSKIAIIVALLILALILLILWLLSLQQAAPVGEPVLDEAGGTISKPLGGQLDTSYGAYVNTNKQPPQPSQPTETTPPAPPDNRSNLKRLAAAFAERYGSFSNNSDYENLLDLKAFMTASMAANTDTYVEDARAKGSASAEYYGMTTRSISTEVTALDETAGTAVVIVTTQRHSSGTLGEKIYYQSIDVKFVKAGDTWQVSAAAWQPAQ